MPAAARCDFVVIHVIRALGFLRPSNVANEPRAAVTGSHKTVGRVGSICLLDGPIKSAFANPNARECDDARITRQAARSDASGGRTRPLTSGTRQPFVANRHVTRRSD